MIPRVIRASTPVHALGAFTLACVLAGCVAGTGSSTALPPEPTGAPGEEPPPLTPEQQALLDRRTQREQTLLAQTLTADSAAEIALLHNPAVERALETRRAMQWIGNTIRSGFVALRGAMTLRTPLPTATTERC